MRMHWQGLVCIGLMSWMALTAGQSEWKPYHSVVGNFKVMLPGQPVWSGTNLSVPGSGLNVAYDSFLLEKSAETVFLISVAHYPTEVDLSETSSVLMEALEGLLLTDETHRLVSSKFEKQQQGIDSLRFHIHASGSKTHLKGAHMLIGQRLILAVIISENEQDLAQDVDPFLSSLTITDLKAVVRSNAQLI
ncbi:MAG: hypothetical protein ACOYKZ_01310 [Chlamydiia bacterium]